MKRLFLLTCVLFSTTVLADEANLIFNGSFEESTKTPGVPDGWTAVGNPAIKQSLARDEGRDGKHCAKLECTAFRGDGPDYHVMLAQNGKVSVRRGQWYRLTLWAKGRNIKLGAVDVGLVNTQGWVNSGLAETFTPQASWDKHEFLFQSKADVPAATSRLQIWFKGTGTLWLDDITLVETKAGIQWYPQIETAGVKNLVPNSSFECGTAGWGSIAQGLDGWTGNLFRLEGDWDGAVASHGGHSLKIALDARTAPVCWFDYYEPVRKPVRQILAANQGWFRVEPGAPLTLSVFLKADAEKTVAQLAIIEAPALAPEERPGGPGLEAVRADRHAHRAVPVPRRRARSGRLRQDGRHALARCRAA